LCSHEHTNNEIYFKEACHLGDLTMCRPIGSQGATAVAVAVAVVAAAAAHHLPN
jgi:hypothetical protein